MNTAVRETATDIVVAPQNRTSLARIEARHYACVQLAFQSVRESRRIDEAVTGPPSCGRFPLLVG